jgi:putative DNA primase/helicase
MSDPSETTATEETQSDVFGLFNIHQELTDMGNADRFVNVCGDDFRYCTLWHKWLYWNGKSWKIDDGEMVVNRAMKFVRYCRDIAKSAQLPKKFADALGDYLYKCENNSKIQAMLTLARAKLSIAPDELDRDPWLFNCSNGTLDLRTGEIRPHDREDLISKMSPVAYSPMSECPKWEAFLEDIMMGKKELIEFLQAYLGYCLTGTTGNQLFVIAYGTGQNGKTVLGNVLLKIMGTYADELPVAMIMRKKGDEEKIEGMHRFMGLRLALFAEGEHGQQLAEGKIKTLTGGDKINARFLYGEGFSFSSSCKLILRTNHKPQIYGTDHAIWRRVNLMPFDYRIPDDKKVDHYDDVLVDAEAAGILDWMIQGCVFWQRNGLPKSESIKESTETYRLSEDPIGDFLSSRCLIMADGRSTVKTLYENYVGFCEGEKIKPLGKKNFNQTLEERDFARKKFAEGSTWYGIALRGEASESPAEKEIPF